MGTRLIAVTLLLLCASAPAEQNSTKRKIACMTPRNASSCYWTHGRLTFCCGTPAVRLWKIGTHRVLGIYSGPEAYDAARGEIIEGDNENPGLPKALSHAVSRFRAKSQDHLPPAVLGEFEVCPLEQERPHTMQAACIEAAKDFTLR
jgi:hypothetical protein